MKHSSFAHVLVTCLFAVPFAAGCEGAGTEQGPAESAPELVGASCAGDDCSAESTASADAPSVLAEAPAELAVTAPSTGLGVAELEQKDPGVGTQLPELPQLGELPGVLDAARGKPAPRWTEEKQDRFGNMFRLDASGNLFRFYGGALQCQVTDKVLGFKMNMHDADEAVAYLVRNEGQNNGVLYALVDSPTFGTRQCPKSVRIQALSQISGPANDAYKLVSNTRNWELGTTVSMMAVNRVGDLVGWRGRAAVWVNHPSVKFEDVSMNTCYGAKDTSFSSYAAFVLEKTSSPNKRVLKVKGRNTVADSKWDTRTFTSIKEFKDFYKVCTKGSDSYAPPPPPPTFLTTTVTCSSTSNSFQVCDPRIGSTGFVDRVELVRQSSRAACRSKSANATFGADSKSIWTADGCGGTFRVTYVRSFY